MKPIKQFKILIRNFMVCFCFLALVFGFSLVNAQEETLSGDNTSANIVSDTDASNSNAAALTTDNIAIPPETVSNNLTDPIAPISLGEQNPPADSQISSSESASTTPAIFEFSQQDTASATTPVLDNKVSQGDSAPDNSAVNGSAATSYDIPTGITRNVDVNGLAILAQWQMLDKKDNNLYEGADDGADIGAQILPSGQYQVDKKIAVCAVVADTPGETDLVSATINYPKDVAVNSDDSRQGCGQEKSQIELNRVDKNEAIQMVCDKIRNNNNNLLSWNKDKTENYTYGYEQICGQEGMIATEKAGVYCGESALAYNDPAGDYQISTKAENSKGQSDITENELKYLELTTFENDFTDIQYGMVEQNQLKILKGDSIWGSQASPTIRNIGNTRLQIKIWQNDFNFGQTNGVWNLEYRAKVGNQADFISYLPEQVVLLNDPLDLGQSANIDFAILIKKFPEASDQQSFSGKMTLTADKAPNLTCQQ